VCPRVRVGTPLFVSVPHACPSIPALIMVAAANPRNLRLVDILQTAAHGIYYRNESPPNCIAIDSRTSSRADYTRRLFSTVDFARHIRKIILPPQLTLTLVFQACIRRLVA
jgi:hypothetical protein